MKKDISISIAKANFYALITPLPFILILFGVNIYIWKWRNFISQLFINNFQSFIIFMLLVFLGIPIRGFIVGRTWQLFGKNKSNTVRHRFSWKSMALLVNCKEPIEVNKYRLGIAMPGIILGFLPAVIGILTGNAVIFVFGLFGVYFAGGDILTLWLIRNVKAGYLVEDHPTRLGCYVTDTKED